MKITVSTVSKWLALVTKLRALLGLAHKGVVQVERVVDAFDKMIVDLEDAIAKIDGTKAANVAEIEAKRAKLAAVEAAKALENATLSASREKAEVLKGNLARLIGQ